MNKIRKSEKAPKSRTPTGILFKQKQILNTKLSLRCYTGTRYVKFATEIKKESL